MNKVITNISEDISNLKETLERHNAYVIASIGGGGCYIGSLKEISLDANGDLVIVSDIDNISCTK